MTSDYIRALETAECPDCGSEFIPGPRGAMSQNFYCQNRTNCGAAFNLTIIAGKLVTHQRIDRPIDETYEMYAKIWRD